MKFGCWQNDVIHEQEENMNRDPETRKPKPTYKSGGT